MYNLWVWEQSSWRVIASYRTRGEAVAAARHAADPPDTWKIAHAGTAADEYIRSHCTERMAPWSVTKAKGGM